MTSVSQRRCRDAGTLERGLYGRDQHSEIERDEIDVGHGDGDMTRDDNSFVENPVDEISKNQALIVGPLLFA